MKINHIEGNNKRKVMVYALSTCGWCKKTKELLKEMRIGYDYIDVDLLEGTEKDEVMAEMKKWNARGSFPTIVIDDNVTIVGFDEQELKKELEQ